MVQMKTMKLAKGRSWPTYSDIRVFVGERQKGSIVNDARERESKYILQSNGWKDLFFSETMHNYHIKSVLYYGRQKFLTPYQTQVQKTAKERLRLFCT